MSKTLDYSVWDHIEISDDEDDTHPNVDTPSLFRWRHQARVQRMEETKQEKDMIEKSHQQSAQKLNEMKRKLKEAEEKSAADELSKLKLQVSDLEKQEELFKKKEEELMLKEKNTPWNIDTICHAGPSKTLINKDDKLKKTQLTEDEKWERQQTFTKKYEKEMKKFGMLQKHEDSQNFLLEYPDVVCEETANYLVLWCINLEVEEKHDLMSHVAHQTIVLQFIMELAKQLDRDPRSCIRPFFTRIRFNDKQYQDAFNDELNSFKDRVRQRAKVRFEEALKQVEEEERQKRMGPGGLDPVEVFEALPDELKACFESKDIGLLQETIAKLPRTEAEYHMKRCVESGLWVPDANAGKKPQEEEEDDDDGSDTEYSTPEEAKSDEKSETKTDPKSEEK